MAEDENNAEDLSANVSAASDVERLKKHTKFFKRCMNILPSYCQNLDTSRITLLFFCLSGLDVLDSLELTPSQIVEIKDWIYAQQVFPDPNDPTASDPIQNMDKNSSTRICGFRSASFLGVPYNYSEKDPQYPCDCSHIAMTYTAMACLLILEDDFSRLNKQAVLAGVRALQQPDGSFCSTIEGAEKDMRFVYCACCVSQMLDDWSGVDKDRAVQYIRNSQGYDSGFGQGPGLESHGGSTFCAVASLVLMDRLSDFSERELRSIRKWCIRRQMSGFQGRPNKPPDTCYSFWVGATLELLDHRHFINMQINTEFIFSTEGQYTGGFAKWPESHPDPLHSYLGLCGLSLSDYPYLRPIHPALNISQRTADWLGTLHTREMHKKKLLLDEHRKN